jgi:hypothetical protein
MNRNEKERRMKPQIVRAVAAMMIVTFAGCDSSTGPGEELFRAQVRWSAHAPSSYSVTIQKGCFCPVGAIGPVIVTVTNGTVTSRVYAATGMPVPAQFASAFPDVPGLFSAIERGMQEKYFQIDADFDPTFGFPTRIIADVNQGTADDEFDFSVTNFTAK